MTKHNLLRCFVALAIFVQGAFFVGCSAPSPELSEHREFKYVPGRLLVVLGEQVIDFPPGGGEVDGVRLEYTIPNDWGSGLRVTPPTGDAIIGFALLLEGEGGKEMKKDGAHYAIFVRDSYEPSEERERKVGVAKRYLRKIGAN